MRKILIVEDEVNICEGLAKIVNNMDDKIEVYETGSAGEALKISETNKIDIFILDMQLEDYSGLILAEQIRKMDIYKLTPIIFVTGDSCNEMNAYRKTHCYTYITKPFREEVISNILKDIMTNEIIKKQSDPKIIIKEKWFNYVIDQKDIIYIEARNNDLFIKTCYEELDIKKYALSKFSKQLTSQFIQCHKSFIVNSFQVTKIDKANNILHIREQNATIPIGRKYKDSVLKSLSERIET
jgi:two-component system LytT family response regulator